MVTVLLPLSDTYKRKNAAVKGGRMRSGCGNVRDAETQHCLWRQHSPRLSKLRASREDSNGNDSSNVPPREMQVLRGVPAVLVFGDYYLLLSPYLRHLLQVGAAVYLV